MVAESTSPVGRGTAGLLLINGMPFPPALFGINGTVAGELPAGAGPGEAAWRGRNGHGNAGDDGSSPPDDGSGAGAPVGGSSGGIVEETLIANF